VVITSGSAANKVDNKTIPENYPEKFSGFRS
jgi:hypothetical protein